MLDSSISIRHLIFTNMFAMIRILFAWPTSIFDYDFLRTKGGRHPSERYKNAFSPPASIAKRFAKRLGCDWEISLQLQKVSVANSDELDTARHAETRACLAPVISDTSCAHYFSFFCANCCSIRVRLKLVAIISFCAQKWSNPSRCLRAWIEIPNGRNDAIGRHHARAASSRRPFCFHARSFTRYQAK